MKMVSRTWRTNPDRMNYYNQTFENSGVGTYEEFQMLLLDNYNKDDQPKIETRTVEVQKELQPNELIINLSSPELFALRGTILGTPIFAQTQNELIDRLKGKKPFLYSGELFSPEFKDIWVRNIVITKEMSAEQKEEAVKHNMAAFLRNMFMVHLIEGNISVSSIDAGQLKDFILKSTPKKEVKTQLTPVQNETVTN